jgi:hypothetical protein
MEIRFCVGLKKNNFLHISQNKSFKYVVKIISKYCGVAGALGQFLLNILQANSKEY